MFAYRNEALYATSVFLKTENTSSRSLRVRRLFYVASLAVVGITGVLPLKESATLILNTIAHAVLVYEKTKKFYIPKKLFDEHDFYDKGNTTYVILTKHGLYHLTTDEFTELDDQKEYTFGYGADALRLCIAKLKSVEKAFETMNKYNPTFFSKEPDVMHRAICGDKFIHDPNHYFDYHEVAK